MVEFGFYALVLSLCLSLYATVMGGLSFYRPHRGIIYSSRNALIAVNLCVTIASAILWIALLTNDFSVSYVFRNSASDMPPLYLLTSFWSSLEGSHLLWTLIMSIVVTLSLLTVREKNESLLPGLLVCYGFSLSFMTLLLVWASAPLTRMFPLQDIGQGMNALLQNPYMAAHPPSLFAGYCSLIVPFGYSVAALMRGSFTSDWLVSVRRWTLAGWAILSVGIFLGGKWAYVELGWAGYWAWDPVENSSFMPWLAATSLLHTLLILDKTNRLPRLACVLAGLGFILTFLGTFITRSGVISSVHSFAESNIGPAYLIYIVIWMTLLLLLVGLRGHLLQGAAQAQTWVVSKESALLFTNFFLLFLLALVCIGTLLPLIVEAVRGVKISIQQPFFNAFAPWIGVGLVALLGVGNLMGVKSKIQLPVCCFRQFGLPFLQLSWRGTNSSMCVRLLAFGWFSGLHWSWSWISSSSCVRCVGMGNCFGNSTAPIWVLGLLTSDSLSQLLVSWEGTAAFMQRRSLTTTSLRSSTATHSPTAECVKRRHTIIDTSLQ